MPRFSAQGGVGALRGALQSPAQSFIACKSDQFSRDKLCVDSGLPATADSVLPDSELLAASYAGSSTTATDVTEKQDSDLQHVQQEYKQQQQQQQQLEQKQSLLLLPNRMYQQDSEHVSFDREEDQEQHEEEEEDEKEQSVGRRPKNMLDPHEHLHEPQLAQLQKQTLEKKRDQTPRSPQQTPRSPLKLCRSWHSCRSSRWRRRGLQYQQEYELEKQKGVEEENEEEEESREIKSFLTLLKGAEEEEEEEDKKKSNKNDDMEVAEEEGGEEEEEENRGITSFSTLLKGTEEEEKKTKNNNNDEEEVAEEGGEEKEEENKLEEEEGRLEEGGCIREETAPCCPKSPDLQASMASRLARVREGEEVEGGVKSSSARGQSSLVSAIRSDFYSCCGGQEHGVALCKFLSAEGLALHWARLAAVEHGQMGCRCLSALEKEAIAVRVVQLMQDMDLKSNDRIGVDEWVHYMLLLRANCAAKQVNSLLDRALKYNARILQDLQGMFEEADSTGSGVLTFSEIVAMYSRKLWFFRPSGDTTQQLTNDELVEGDPEKFAREIVQAMDLDGDERISYGEFMAYILGRRKHEVRLHLYDLSGGAAEGISPWVLGQRVEGIWHTGTVVFDKEYHYSRDAVHGPPGATVFGKPTREIHLGYTLWRKDEFHKFISQELKVVFQRDTYDVVCNNCNHFTDRVCRFLLGKRPPEEVLRQPETLMKSWSVRALRPVLNWWVRDNIATRDKNANEVTSDDVRSRLLPEDDPPSPGTAVYIHPAEGAGPPILGVVAKRPQQKQPTSVMSMQQQQQQDQQHELLRRPSLEIDLRENTEVGVLPTYNCCGNAHNSTVASSLWAPCNQHGRLPTFCTCSAALLGRAPEEGLWVHHFELLPEPSGTCRGHVLTELVPHAHLSLATLAGKHEESTYKRAHVALKLLSSDACQGHHATAGLDATPATSHSMGNGPGWASRRLSVATTRL